MYNLRILLAVQSSSGCEQTATVGLEQLSVGRV